MLALRQEAPPLLSFVNAVHCERVQWRGCGESDVELFWETLERKVCKGKNNNENTRRYEALLNNTARHSRSAL